MLISVLFIRRAISFKIANYIAKQKPINALKSYILYNMQLLIPMPLKIFVLHMSH
jgi:hypothetical protein